MSILRSFVAALFVAVAAMLPSGARAQSGCSIFTFNNVPTAGQWNQCLQLKQDLLGYTAVNRAGDVMAGRLATTASTTFRAGFAVAPGIAPSAPLDGDIWTTTGGIFVRINGATIGPLTATGSTIPSVIQGDLLYGSAPGVLSALAKNTTATRYVANTGTSNNPAWAQINLANGVTGLLALANLATGTQDTALGYYGSTAVSAATLPNCTGALTYSTSTHLFGCNTSSVFISGTPTANQIAQWTNATTIQGVNLVSLLAAGGGISLSGTTTVTVALANNGSVFQTSPANPTGTSSVTQVMMGLGSTCKITPGFSTRLRFTIIGNIFNTTAGQGGTYIGTFGSGAAPANGAAASGTAFISNSIAFTSTSGQNLQFVLVGTATGLTAGVQYWFDAAMNVTANSGAMSNLTCSAQEF